MIYVPFLVLGALLVLSALFGARVREGGRGAVVGFILSPLHPATWLATLAIVAGFWVELVAFVLVIGAFSSGASLLVVGIGVVLIGVGIELSRITARIERRRAMFVDPRPLRPHAYRPSGARLGDLLTAVFLDVSRWRDVVYVFVAFPLTVLEFVAVVVLWSMPLALLTVPSWDGPTGTGPRIEGLALSPEAVSVVAVVVGIALLPVAASVAQGLMRLHRAVIGGLLCDTEERRLQRRVATLEGSRRAVLDVEASELRRIERDLHDGAQQRLVRLTMDLGMAADRIESDPVAARSLVLDAQGQARQALAELRDLVRGIAPAILLDRGLAPALSALAARAPVPTTVHSTLPTDVRPSDAVERAAYFVVAEALANVAKHAAATRCEIRCRPEPRALVVEVWDDGAGGAQVMPGGGLAGLVGRVEALDGTLTMDSPDGGPTLVRATLPVTGVRAVTVSPVVAGEPAAEAEAAPVGAVMTAGAVTAPEAETAPEATATGAVATVAPADPGVPHAPQPPDSGAPGPGSPDPPQPPEPGAPGSGAADAPQPPDATDAST